MCSLKMNERTNERMKKKKKTSMTVLNLYNVMPRSSSLLAACVCVSCSQSEAKLPSKNMHTDTQSASRANAYYGILQINCSNKYLVSAIDSCNEREYMF